MKNKAVEQWAELSEQTFDFACYSHIWYANGDEKTKRAILTCLGSNLTISNKILKVSYTSYFLSLIKAREAIEKEIERARTSQKPMVTKQNRHFMPALSVGLRTVDELRTVNWTKIKSDLLVSGMLQMF